MENKEQRKYYIKLIKSDIKDMDKACNILKDGLVLCKDRLKDLVADKQLDYKFFSRLDSEYSKNLLELHKILGFIYVHTGGSADGK